MSASHAPVAPVPAPTSRKVPAGLQHRLQQVTQECSRGGVPPVGLLGFGHPPVLRHLHGSLTS